MEIAVDNKVRYPREVVFTAMRDRLPELARFLPNVDDIQVRERTEPAEGVVHLVNLWKAAKTEIPAVARPFIDPSKLNWVDRATWTQADWTTAWDLEVGFMPQRVHCKGETTYLEAEDNQTLIRMRGKLELDLKGLLPGILAKSATPKVEGFVVKLIQPNFEKTIDALVKLLDEQGAKA